MIERSSGFIIFYINPNEGFDNDNKIEYLFLFKNKSGGFWDFPKGHVDVERNESDMDSAVRELREETGITDFEVIPGFKEEIVYMIPNNGNNESIEKHVVLFIARVKRKDVKISKEHTKFMWMNFDEAMSSLKYENHKKVLTKADKFLKSFLS